MRYLSVCSGIEAATVAWHPLGWTPAAFSEIEAFPRAVLKHHYPTVPCHGDFTTIEGHEYGSIDLLVGGTPCQDFSIAGLRAGIAGERGNLTLEFLRLAARARPRWLVWENVPGVLSSDGGRTFGAVLGGLAELGYGFAYRVLDAQHFGLAQRRARVFVIGYLGDWRRAAAVLFERESLGWDSPPCRTAGESPPGAIGARTGLSVGAQDVGAGHIISTANISHCLNAGGMGRQDYETETLITHSLCADGFDASEDGTGRGTPLVPVDLFDKFQRDGFMGERSSAHAFDARQSDVVQYGDKTGPLDTDGYTMGVCIDKSHANGGVMPAVTYAIQERATSENPASGPDGVGVRGDGTAYTLEARSVPQAVAFDTTQITSKSNYSNPKAGDPCHPLAAGAHPPAVALDLRNALRDPDKRDATNRQGCGIGDDLSHTLSASVEHGVATASAVRRLTPMECERLQGFPDGYTLVPYRGKPAADGPRYKALGNSMAVPCMRWLGERIQMVEDMLAA